MSDLGERRIDRHWWNELSPRSTRFFVWFSTHDGWGARPDVPEGHPHRHLSAFDASPYGALRQLVEVVIPAANEVLEADRAR